MKPTREVTNTTKSSAIGNADQKEDSGANSGENNFARELVRTEVGTIVPATEKNSKQVQISSGSSSIFNLTGLQESIPVPIRGRHLLGSQWREGDPKSTEMMVRQSPAQLGVEVGRFPVAKESEVEEAVGCAKRAFLHWRKISRIERAECFNRLAKIIESQIDSLAELMAWEVGKTLNECKAEVIEGLHMVQYVFGTGRMPTGHLVASEISDKEAMIYRKPRGVVAAITPWNFPFAVPLWMLGPSLLEGNTAVFKPSEDSPAIGQRLVELFLEAKFPAEVIQLVHGDGKTGECLVKQEDVQVILFTGSSVVGQRIQELSASKKDRIVAAEMGGKSAVMVCSDARLELAVSSALISAFKTSGHRCVSAGRVLVAESLLPQFTRSLVARTKQLKIGHPFDPRSFTGPLINAFAVEKVMQYNQLAAKEGAEILLPGEIVQKPELQQGYYVSPCIYQMKHRPESRCLREEVFGPHLAIIPFHDLDEAIEIYNDTDYGLSMSVITEDFRVMRKIREECDFGMGYVNLPCIGAEVHLPFGGVKRSGNGHPSAAGLVSTVTHQVAWTLNHATEIKMAQGLEVN